MFQVSTYNKCFSSIYYLLYINVDNNNKKMLREAKQLLFNNIHNFHNSMYFVLSNVQKSNGKLI